MSHKVCWSLLLLLVIAQPAIAQDPPPSQPFVEQFWPLAWNLQYVEGQSGMVLEDMGGGLFHVLVTDTTDEDVIVAEGTYSEVERLALDSLELTQAELEAAGIITYDHFVVAGTISGSTGFQSALYGLATVLVVPGQNPENPPIVVHAFTPLALAPDEPSAIGMAYDYWELNEGPEFLMLAGGSLDGTVCESPPGMIVVVERDCTKEARLCRDAATLRHQARCDVILGATTIEIGACALVCTGTLIAYPLCLAGCGALALTAEALALNASSKELQADYLDCERERLQCEAEKEAEETERLRREFGDESAEPCN